MEVCSPSMNRRMRTRMSGGVGGGAKSSPLPDSESYISFQSACVTIVDLRSV